ncbi:MAG: hypothetical protein PVSMB7_25470 [Chloroflexota bacterium]
MAYYRGALTIPMTTKSRSTSGATSQPALTDADYRDQAGFRRALRQFLHFSEEQARVHGITPQQHLLLLIVRGHESYPHVTVGDSAEALKIRHHSASLLVDRCVRRGLLYRNEDSEDRRRVNLSLTADGERVLGEITQANRMKLGALETDLFPDGMVSKIRDLGVIAQAALGRE